MEQKNADITRVANNGKSRQGQLVFIRKEEKALIFLERGGKRRQVSVHHLGKDKKKSGQFPPGIWGKKVA